MHGSPLTVVGRHPGPERITALWSRAIVEAAKQQRTEHAVFAELLAAEPVEPSVPVSALEALLSDWRSRSIHHGQADECADEIERLIDTVMGR